MEEPGGPSTQTCSKCGNEYKSYAQHVRRWPDCRVASVPQESCAPCDSDGPTVPAPAAPTSARADTLAFDEMSDKLGTLISRMHLTARIKMEHCEAAVDLAAEALKLQASLIKRALSKATGGNELGAAVDSIAQRCDGVVSALKNIDAVCHKHTEGALQPTTRPLLASAAESKKHFAFISLYDLCCDSLQNSALERKWLLESSADWSTGRYRNEPEVINDVTHAQKFRDSRLSRPAEATTDGILRVRFGIQGWNDDATVCSPKARTTLLQDPIPCCISPDPCALEKLVPLCVSAHSSWSSLSWTQWAKPIGTKRKLHKYGVVLGRVINFPKTIRNNRNHLLVLGVYNTRFAKAHGGVCRMISGVGPDGKV